MVDFICLGCIILASGFFGFMFGCYAYQKATEEFDNVEKKGH